MKPGLTFLLVFVLAACAGPSSKSSTLSFSGPYKVRFLIDSTAEAGGMSAVAFSAVATIVFSDTTAVYRATLGGFDTGDQVWGYEVVGDSLIFSKPAGPDVYLVRKTPDGYDLIGHGGKRPGSGNKKGVQFCTICRKKIENCDGHEN